MKLENKMIITIARKSLVVLTLSIFSVGTVYAETAQEKGLRISEETKNRDLNWNDSSAKLEMILKNKHGETSIRKMKIKSIEQENDGDKSLNIFDSPKDVKGTAFLSFSHPVGNDDQWLYLPALKRVKRISSRNKSGSFMGSEFSFEDFTSFEIEKYTYEYLRDEVIDGEDCWVVIQYPVDKYSGYKKRVVWVDKTEYRLRKTDFYDRKDTHLKTLVFSDFHLINEKYWRPQKLSMANHQSGKSTILNFTEYKLDQGLSDKDFNKNALKRAR